MSVGQRIEIYKEAGDPRDFVVRFGLDRSRPPTPSGTRGWRPRAASPPSTPIRSRPGSTSAWSTTARSRTTTGCASFLRGQGIEFQTDNDSEVAAGFLTWRLSEGDDLKQRWSAA